MPRMPIKLKRVNSPAAVGGNAIMSIAADLSPGIVGVGYTEYVCVECGKVLVKGKPNIAIQGVVLKCEKCNTYNTRACRKLLALTVC